MSQTSLVFSEWTKTLKRDMISHLLYMSYSKPSCCKLCEQLININAMTWFKSVPSVDRGSGRTLPRWSSRCAWHHYQSSSMFRIGCWSSSMESQAVVGHASWRRSLLNQPTYRPCYRVAPQTSHHGAMFDSSRRLRCWSHPTHFGQNQNYSLVIISLRVIYFNKVFI